MALRYEPAREVAEAVALAGIVALLGIPPAIFLLLGSRSVGLLVWLGLVATAVVGVIALVGIRVLLGSRVVKHLAVELGDGPLRTGRRLDGRIRITVKRPVRIGECTLRFAPLAAVGSRRHGTSSYTSMALREPVEWKGCAGEALTPGTHAIEFSVSLPDDYPASGGWIWRRPLSGNRFVTTAVQVSWRASLFLDLDAAPSFGLESKVPVDPGAPASLATYGPYGSTLCHAVLDEARAAGFDSRLLDVCLLVGRQEGGFRPEQWDMVNWLARQLLGEEDEPAQWLGARAAQLRPLPQLLAGVQRGTVAARFLTWVALVALADAQVSAGESQLLQSVASQLGLSQAEASAAFERARRLVHLDDAARARELLADVRVAAGPLGRYASSEIRALRVPVSCWLLVLFPILPLILLARRWWHARRGTRPYTRRWESPQEVWIFVLLHLMFSYMASMFAYVFLPRLL